MGNKANKAQVAQRTEDVFTMLCRGYTRAEIMQYAANETWRLSVRQMDTYISKANQKILETSKTVHEDELGKAIANYRELYKKCYEINDFKACKDIQKEIGVLLGLAEPMKIGVFNAEELTTEELIARAAAAKVMEDKAGEA